MVGSRSQRSLARAQRDVNSGPAAATPPPPGPQARGHPDTRRGSSAPAPCSHAGRRFEVKQGDWGSRKRGPLAAGPGVPVRSFAVRQAREALGLPRGDGSPSADPGPSLQGRRPPPPGWIRTGRGAETTGGEGRLGEPGSRLPGCPLTQHSTRTSKTPQSNHPQPPRLPTRYLKGRGGTQR